MKSILGMLLLSGTLLLATTLVASAAPLTKASVAPKAGEMPTMNYEELGRVVREQKGKVLVVYFWANY